MAPKRGAAGAASSRSVGKRKSREPRNRDTTTGSRAAASSRRWKSDYKGVRNRGHTVEVKRLEFYMDVKESEGVAALVYDLVQSYEDINWEPRNVEILESKMQKEDPALAGFGEPVKVGSKEFLISFVKEHPLDQVGSTPKERVNSMKEAIIVLASEAFKGLKKEIADKLSRAGCYRRETEEILPAMEYNDPPEDSKEKIKRLESQIASMKVTHAEELKALKEELTTERDPIGRHEHFSNVDWIENIDWRVMTAGQQSTD